MIVDQQQFKVFFETSSSLTDLAIKLGWIRYQGGGISGTAYREIKRLCSLYGFDYARLSNRNKIEEFDHLLPLLVRESKSIKEVIVKIGKNQDSGSLSGKIRNRIVFLGLDTSHFTGQGWAKGKNRFTDKRVDKLAKNIETPWDEAFKIGSRVKNSQLMKRLVLSGKRKYECCICGLKLWNGKPIRLRIDHEDGNNINNEESNLRIICPNCDSQEETFCRGTRKKSKIAKWWENLPS